MWLTSKIKQVVVALTPGTVTLNYPVEPRPMPEGSRGAPVWDHDKCVGCGGCADHCPARTIMVRDLCQEIRVLLYDGSRCTYCGRCEELCPEDAIEMTGRFELATDSQDDLTETMELFMLTCQRCGRCYDMENTNMIDKLGLKGYRYDSLESRVVTRKKSETFDNRLFDESITYERPDKV